MSNQNDFFKSITRVAPADKPDQAEAFDPGLRLAPKQEKSLPNGYAEAVKQLVGLTIKNADDILLADITHLIENKIPNALDGYVHCLSRLMRHDVAWEILVEAYRKENSKPPSKYAALFGRDGSGNKIVRPNSRWQVG